MSEVSVGAYVFEVAMAGPSDGVPVVALHGFPQTNASWTSVTPGLVAAGCRVIAPNQRGYSPGARPIGVEHYRIEQLTGDILGLLDALDLPSAHLVGHDWGAVVAWHLAAEHPDRVRTLTAASVPHSAAFNWAIREDPDQQERSQYFGLLREPEKAERVLVENDAQRLRAMFGAESLDDEYVRHLTVPGALTAASSWYAAMTREFANLPPVTVPTTYVWSNGDTAIGRAGAERCGEFVDAPYRFVELDGISHWIPEEAPGELTAEILARIDSVQT
ncbi:alpha/beta fold hydrolase [Rhodococcoides fascians]|uniref:alpha/beta fold hydrolase n=1 Tax=Rhodococcoides fascians TaxID=1828 RepID=UPI00050C4491|nr:alpha/beta hydrolase [Rhodococcus fascians]